MAFERDVTRRAFLAGVAGAIVIPRIVRGAEASEAPTVAGKVEKPYKDAGLQERDPVRHKGQIGEHVVDPEPQPRPNAPRLIPNGRRSHTLELRGSQTLQLVRF